MPLMKPEEVLYVRSMGKALRVLAVCSTVDEANALMRRRTELAVVASFDHDTRVYLADQYDQGENIEARSMRAALRAAQADVATLLHDRPLPNTAAGELRAILANIDAALAAQEGPATQPSHAEKLYG